MNFDCIIGQEDIVRTLKYSLESGRVGHAYLFCGSKGIGKRTVAKVFAHQLLCTDLTAGQACGACLSCRLLAEGTNPDFHMIEPDRNGSIGVDEIRDMQENLMIKPLYATRKVCIIANADSMTAQAQNCLLKTLEEPPSYTVIILTAENDNALVDTVRSRSVKINFKKNTRDEVVRALKVLSGSSPKEADFIISYSEGIIGRALELAGSKDFIMLREQTYDMLTSLHTSGTEGVFSVYPFFELNKDRFNDVLDIMVMYYRDLLVSSEVGSQNILINSDKKDIIVFNASGFSDGKLMSNIEMIEQTRNYINHNANYQLAIEAMLLKLQEA